MPLSAAKDAINCADRGWFASTLVAEPVEAIGDLIGLFFCPSERREVGGCALGVAAAELLAVCGLGKMAIARGG